MSSRTVSQFSLSGLMAVLCTSLSLAQFDPGAQFDPKVEAPMPSRPELSPMPREKPSTLVLDEGYIVPSSGTIVHPPFVPAPPLCAFDQQMNIFPVVPGIPQAYPVAGCANSEKGFSGSIILNGQNGDLYLWPLTQPGAGGVKAWERIQNQTEDATVRFPLNLVNIRWDEAGGGWWVETIRLPQLRLLASSDAAAVEKPSCPHHSEDLQSKNKVFVIEKLCEVQPVNGVAAAAPAVKYICEDHPCCNSASASAHTPTPCCASSNKMAGTWVREMEGFRIVATVSGDELKFCLSQNVQGTTLSYILTTDCTITKEGLVHGAVTGADAELKRDPIANDRVNIGLGSMDLFASIEPQLPQLLASVQSLVDCPFSFRARMTSAGMMISNLKIASSFDELKDSLSMVCGMYKFSKDGNLPALKPRKTPLGQTWRDSTPDVLTGAPEVGMPPGIPLGPGAGAACGSSVDRQGQQQDVIVRFVIPGCANSNTGSCGNVIVNERNFDIRRCPDNAPPTGYYPAPVSSYPSPTGYSPAPVSSYPSPTGYYPPSVSSYPSPTAVVRPMLPPEMPALPPPVECPQKCVPNSSSGPLGAATPCPMMGARQENKQVFSFAIDQFGHPVEMPEYQCPSVSSGFTGPRAQPEWAPRQPANVPAPVFDVLADTFGQMLNDSTCPPVATVPQVAPYCPVQVIQGVQPTTVTLIPCTTAIPAAKTVVGTWVRVVGPAVYAFQMTPDHMTISAASSTEFPNGKVVTECTTMTCDYQMMRDGTTAIGLITSFDTRLEGDLPSDVDFDGFVEELSKLQKALTDKPFAMSIRLYGETLVIGNVRLPEVEMCETMSPMTVIGGRYTSAGDKPMPKPKVVKAPMQPRACPVASPPAAFNPGVPTVATGAPISIGMVPSYVNSGAIYPPPMPSWSPGDTRMIQVAPSYPSPVNTYPNPWPAAPCLGVTGCGGLMMPSLQPNMPPAVMPPPVHIPSFEGPMLSPVPHINVPYATPNMPSPLPLTQPGNQSFSPPIPVRVEYIR